MRLNNRYRIFSENLREGTVLVSTRGTKRKVAKLGDNLILLDDGRTFTLSSLIREGYKLYERPET